MPTVKFHYFERQVEGDKPAGVTVSKNEKLPEGDFGITEYTWTSWSPTSFWFGDVDDFSEDERQKGYRERRGGRC